MLTPTEVDFDPHVELQQGRVTSALTNAEMLAELDEASEDPELLALLVHCRLARGELALALRLGAQLVATPGRPPSATHALAELAVATDRPADALAFLEQLGPEAPIAIRADRALALTRAGRTQEAAEMATALVVAARAGDSAYDLAAALRVFALVAHVPDRLALLTEAADVIAEVEADRLAAQIDTDRAALLLLSGGIEARRSAVGLLRSAESYAAGEELAPLLHRVRNLLVRAGEQPRTTRAELMQSLTTREQAIADLAAAGRTNKAIAAETEISVKAVEWHLSHVYRKLGLSGRTALAAALS